MELTPREKDKLLIFTASIRTRGHAPLYIPYFSEDTASWN
jgi:hypothetical protein